MQLQSGTRLGPYEIVERLGAGGMGEVYRARDTRLSRSVAIKVLPSEFAGDAQLRARFDREAKTISSLNHPNICTLHDVGSENGVDYLVLEYCEGQTLAGRLDHGPLPIDQVFEHGIEIAEALSRAHRSGIVHRDLKPSNIMLTKSGVKLLDFGLAKQKPSVADDRTTSLQGQIVGTLQYMAPEVLTGHDADPRSDLFALGLVLYEMLTGSPAFTGSSKASVIASILEHPPQPIPSGAPAALAHVIEKCLCKQPDERWESAHDVAEELRWARSRDVAPVRSARPMRIAFGVAAVVALIATLLAIRFATRTPAEPVVRLSVSVPPDAWIELQGGTPNVAISPDGRWIAYILRIGNSSQLFVRAIDSFEGIRLVGSDGQFVVQPFFSPDGRWVGYTTDDGRMMKVPLSGGAPVTIYNKIIGTGRGATWAPDGTIYFSPSATSGIWKIPSAGGEAQQVTKPDPSAGENSHRWPSLLPDGKHLLYMIRTDRITSFDDAKIAAFSLQDHTSKLLVEGATRAVFLRGQLIYGRAGSVFAAPFDPASLAITGPARKVIDSVATGPVGTMNFNVSSTGDLVYLPGTVTKPKTELFAADRAGRTRPLTTLPFNVQNFELSPDERRIVMAVSAANDDIWLYDLVTGVSTRLSYERGDEALPIWLSDGTRVIYTSLSDGKLLIKNADGSSDSEVLMPQLAFASSCSPDGRLLAFYANNPETHFDVGLLPLQGQSTPVVLLRSAFNETVPRFSPDGKWIVYQSEESGTREVYVRRSTPGGGRWKLSSDGGTRPRWSKDGREVFYQHGGVYAVALSFEGNEPRPEPPRLLFKSPIDPAAWDYYTVTKDGFLFIREAVDEQRVHRIDVVRNWAREIAP